MRILVLSFILAAAAVASACYADVASPDVQAASSAFLRLPDQMNAVVDQQLPPSDTKKMLRALIRESCTDPLLQRLEFWIDSLPLESHVFPDVIQELRPQQAVHARGPALVQGDHALTAYAIETDEVFSLSSNLNSIDELFDSFRIANMDREEAQRALEQHAVPEIVEIRVHAKKYVELELKLIDGRWKVQEVRVQPQSATMEIPSP